MKKNLVLLVMLFLVLNLAAAWSCTNLIVQAADGTVIRARSMEMVAGVSKMLAVPQGYQYACSLPDGQPGMKWAGKYGYVGIGSADINIVSDGMNEKGLTFGMLEFPNFVGYSSFDSSGQGKSVAPWEFGSWMLANFATVDEVVKNINGVRIVGSVKPPDAMLPLHYMVTDPSGRSVVIEPVNGTLKVHENPVGAMTNAPDFDWQLVNLKNYIELHPEDCAPKTLKGGLELKQTGTGSGMLGLPGDQTPASRFVRAVYYTQNLTAPKDAEECLQDAIGILNTFFRVEGSNYQMQNGKQVSDITDWETFSDLTNLRYYYRTYRDSDIRLLDLKKLDFKTGAVKNYPLAEKPAYRDYTDRLK